MAIFRCDAYGHCRYVNERWSELTGRSAEAAMGAGWESAIHPQDLSRVREEWRRLVSQHERFCSDYRYLRPDGSVVWAHAEASEETDTFGRVVSFIGCVTETTELHDVRAQLERAHDDLEERVRERTQRWREVAMIIEQTEDAVIRSDLAGRIVGWNRGAERLFGYTQAEVVGGSTLAITPPEEQGLAMEIKRRVRLGEAVQYREVTRLSKGGTPVPVLLSVFPLRNEAGSIMGSAAILRDMREQKKAEHRLRQLSQRLLIAQDEERRRIARELHDSTAQLLVALSIDLGRVCMEDEKLSREQRAKLLAESCLLAERATLEVRTQSYLLHPPMLEERGLLAALRFYIDGFTERSGITVDFQAPRQMARQDDVVELTLFRIVQESLANVHRHSQSERAEIVFKIDGQWIEITIRDFGSGLPGDPEELRGVGIAGMRERLAQLGGTFELESAAPGVKVRGRLPMAPNL